jgi:methionine-S-sulfoxide reductase
MMLVPFAPSCLVPLPCLTLSTLFPPHILYFSHTLQDGTFGLIPGVIRTRVGYSGGTPPSASVATPTYRRMLDHTEAIEIDYDPARLSYSDLLTTFFNCHSACSGGSRQYRSAIWYHDKQQQEQAMQHKAARIQGGRKTTTDIEPYSSWTMAEDYHQKYYLQQHGGLMKALGLSKQEWRAMTDSPVATKVNAYVYKRGGNEMRAEAKKVLSEELGVAEDVVSAVCAKI